MFTIRQIIFTHVPRVDMKCWGCNGESVWSEDHVVRVLEENGHDTTSQAK
jgi:hypothetical protein